MGTKNREADSRLCRAVSERNIDRVIHRQFAAEAAAPAPSGSGRPWRQALLAMAVLFVGGNLESLYAQPSQVGAIERVNRWTHRGGPPAGTATTETPITRTKPTLAWEMELDGKLKEEPRLLDDVVYTATFELKRGKPERSLHAHDLLTGKALIAAQPYRTPRALGPALAGTQVIVRSGEDEITGLRMGNTRFRKLWTFRERKSAVGLPLAWENRAYFRAGDALVAWDLRRKKEAWRTAGTFRGRPSLRGDHLYTLRYDDSRAAYLVVIEAASGREIAKGFVGRHAGGKIPDVSDAVHIAVFEHCVLVHHQEEATSAGRSGFLHAMLSRTVKGDTVSLGAAIPIEMKGRAAAFDKGLLFNTGEAEQSLVHLLDPTERRMRMRILTHAPDRHGHYDDVHAPVVGAGLGLLGMRLIELDELTVDWEIGAGHQRRVIPARESLIQWNRDHLSAWRVAVAGDRRAPDYSQATKGGARGRIVLQDGRVLSGELNAPKAGAIEFTATAERDPEPRSLPRESILLALDWDDRVLHLAAGEEGQRGLSLYLSRMRTETLELLAEQACDAKDGDQIESLIDAARAAGGDEARLSKLDRRLRAIRRRRSAPKTAEVQRIAAAAKSLDAELLAREWRVLSTNQAQLPAAFHAARIRRILRAHPEFAPAVEHVRARIPASLRPTGPIPALDWFEFVLAIEQVEISFVEPPTLDQKDLTHSERELGSAQHRWRKDLRGIESENLLILSPTTRPGALARCLSLGELVCKSLEDMTAAYPNQRTKRFPLRIHLFESRDEYLRQADKGKRGGVDPDRSPLAWTAGHYSPMENVSRMYLPEDGASLGPALATFAHELTHHWLAARSPLVKKFEVRHTIAKPGFWIVEGFASLIEEFEFDMERRTFVTLNPRSFSLDFVAHAGENSRLPWDLLFKLSHLQFGQLKSEDPIAVPLRWRLGAAVPMSAKRAFYEQSTATCLYLFHAEGGKHRPALLKFLARFYSGRTNEQTLMELFGKSQRELGEAVSAWSKEIVLKGG